MDLLVRIGIVATLLLGAAVFGWWWNRRSGQMRTGHGGFDRAQLRELGLDPVGAQALGILLGSPTCAPCRAVRNILRDLADERPDFRWVYVDAADHLDIAEVHHVLRVPTLFVLAPDGRILARTSGVPAKHDLERVIERGEVSVPAA